MQIDIDTLTEPELIDLNHRVVGRLQFLGTMRAHAAMLDFSIGGSGVLPPGWAGANRRHADALQQKDGDGDYRHILSD